MIETFCIPLLFIALAINIPILIAYIKGIQLQVKDNTCKQDILDVKKNILAIKLIQGFNVLILLILFIILLCV